MEWGNAPVGLPEADDERHAVGAIFGCGFDFGLVDFGQLANHLFGVGACGCGAYVEVEEALRFLFWAFVLGGG